MTNEEIRERLVGISDNSYADFSKKLIPDDIQILGVRMPRLKELAKEIATSNECGEYLETAQFGSHEEVLLYGLVLGKVNLPIEKLLVKVENWTKYITNWAECDSVVMALKVFGRKKFTDFCFVFLQNFMTKELTPFQKRFVIVCLFRYYLTDDYVDRTIDFMLEYAVEEHYYIHMALAWGVCEVLIKYYDKGLDILKSNKLNTATHNKSIQKAVESYRLTVEQKAELRKLKR